MSRAEAISRAREHFQSGAFLKILDRRVGYRTESQQAEFGRGAARLSDRRAAARLCRARFHHAPRRIAERQGAVPARRIPRGRFAADRADLRPWRRRRRHGGRMARQPRSLAHHHQGRARLRPRHRRQQGPAQHQYVRAAAGARGARRQARFQCKIHHRDRRGNRLARSAQGVREPSRRAQSRPVPRLRRAAAVGGAADHFPRLPRRIAHSSRCEPA